MGSRVFFHSAGASAKKNRLAKVRELYEKAEIGSTFGPGDAVAVKVHWGEPGNVGFLPVPYVRAIVELVRDAGGRPFVTDTNTLYTGQRRNAIDNLQAAAHNGFTPESLCCPILVADGLKGYDGREVPVSGGVLKSAKIASGILDADALIAVSHVKSHMVFGFGGALKNLGMGCATPAGKQVLHSDLRPKVIAERCLGDGLCVKRCPALCIRLVARPGKRKWVAAIDEAACIGCGECTATCPHEAIPVRWNTSSAAIMHKTADYAKAAILGKRGRVGFINCLVGINPDCDCCSWNEPAFVPDQGFLASLDPVAIDVASADLVARARPIPGSKADGCTGDPWLAIRNIDYREIFRYAEKIELGQQAYELVGLS